MKNLIVAIREQQLVVEKLISKYRQEGGDDLFFFVAELERKNAELSASVAKHIADSAPKPEPVATPFDPTFAPPGCKAVPVDEKNVDWNRCNGCAFEAERHVGCCKDRPCMKNERTDKNDAIFVKKETP